MHRAILFLIIYVGLLILPVVAASIFKASTSGNVLYEMGKGFALTGFMILFLQVMLTARIKWIERPFGLDILIRYHKHMAVFGLLLLLVHPLLLAAGGGGTRLLLGLDLPWNIWLGKIALILLVINVLLSLYQTPLNLKFEKWRLGHDLSGPLILVLIFIHSRFTGDDLELIFMQVLWIIMLVLAVGVFAYHRILRPQLLKKHPYRVIQVQPETKDVWTVKLAPPEGEQVFPYLPGQFHFITFYRKKGLPVEEHHWTISSSPTEKKYLSSTIKALGDFTSTMGETQAGDTAVVHGAFGRFSYMFHPDEKDLVFIAGGIGITPLMSMLRHMRDTGDNRTVLLFYANPDEDQIVFRRELSEIESGQAPVLKVVHVLDHPGENWTGEKGHLDREKIQRLCGRDLQEKVFYVCGPPGLLKVVMADLKTLGVTEDKIRLEIFSFLD